MHYSIFCLSFFILLFGPLSCSEEEFTSTVRSQDFNPATEETTALEGCSTSTDLKPKVDFLFLIDNSPSSIGIKDELKNGIKNVVTNISKNFDYHAYFVPLIPEAGT